MPSPAIHKDTAFVFIQAILLVYGYWSEAFERNSYPTVDRTPWSPTWLEAEAGLNSKCIVVGTPEVLYYCFIGVLLGRYI